MTDIRKNGDLPWLRPDGKTQVTIEDVPKVVDEIIEVVPTGARSAAHRGAECPLLRTTGRGRNSGSGPDQSPERISKRIIDRTIDVPVARQRQVPTIQTVRKTLEVPRLN